MVIAVKCAKTYLTISSGGIMKLISKLFLFLNSPPKSETHTIKKEHSHNKNEDFKTMYRSCENANDDDPVTEALDILRAVTKKIKREHTHSSYRNGHINSLSFYKKGV